MSAGPRIRLVLVLVAHLFALVGAAKARAEAPGADAISQARARFDSGRALYRAGRFREALQEFQEGYRLAPRPMFLANIGQAHRQLYELELARDAYRAFLAQTPADDPFRAQAEQIVAELDRAIAARPVPSPIASPTPAIALAPVAAPKKAPFIRRHWWIIPVAAVAAAGIAVGIYFGVRPTGESCESLPLGCVTVMP